MVIVSDLLLRYLSEIYCLNILNVFQDTDFFHLFLFLFQYEKAAAILKTHEPSIILAKVDAHEQKNKVLASKYSVHGFPTLKIFENKGGVVRDYKGPRDVDGIVSYLRREAGPPSEEITSLEQGELSVNEADVLVVCILL